MIARNVTGQVEMDNGKRTAAVPASVEIDGSMLTVRFTTPVILQRGTVTHAVVAFGDRSVRRPLLNGPEPVSPGDDVVITQEIALVDFG
jgi:hypothetical protein